MIENSNRVKREVVAFYDCHFSSFGF